MDTFLETLRPQKDIVVVPRIFIRVLFFFCKLHQNFYSLNPFFRQSLFGQKVSKFLSNFYSLNRFSCQFLFGPNVASKFLPNSYSLNRLFCQFLFGPFEIRSFSIKILTFSTPGWLGSFWGRLFN